MQGTRIDKDMQSTLHAHMLLHLRVFLLQARVTYNQQAAVREQGLGRGVCRHTYTRAHTHVQHMRTCNHALHDT